MALALRGRHQAENAVVAARLLEELAPLGFHVDADAVVAGLTRARWPGRLDLRVAAGGRRVLFDGAHNPAGARVLTAYLREVHAGGLPLVFGIMKDKDVDGTLGPLLPLAHPLICTSAHTDRSLPADALERAARRLGAREVRVEPAPRAALDLAWTFGPLACVAGSIFLVGDLLAEFDRPGPSSPGRLC
jgi:dihydrofolate synthase/folylpolyglutamate synthase